MAHGRGVERVFNSPFGTFDLLRHPFRERSTLRAWDAADAYLLRHLAENPPRGPIAILNDGFGALALGLHQYSPTIVADSSATQTAISTNAERNGMVPPTVVSDVMGVPGPISSVFVKVPKSLGRLEDQLHRVRPALAAGASVTGAGMVRDVHTSTLDLFESIIGRTTTSLARQKARLIHCVPADGRFERTDLENPWPVVWDHDGLVVHNHGGVFSARSVDIGTRFLLEHLTPLIEPEGLVVDLGCGNGILGTAAARTGQNLQLIFIDSSDAAIRSARLTWKANHGDRPAQFRHADRMADVVDRASTDLVINNPPFHDERAVGDATAWDMFVDSHRVLRPGGRLVVVANRHLGHHTRIGKIFGNAETVAANRKFVILSAIR